MNKYFQIISVPLKEENIEKLKAGNKVLINGTIYTARDAAHKKLYQAIKDGVKLPFDLQGQIIYYVGPTPKKKGSVIGSAGPTTSSRMDYYTPLLLQKGLKGMIGKGYRSEEVKKAIKKYKAVYFAATGGAGALLSKCVKKAEVIAYEELGAEAIYKLLVQNFPVIVINDIYGQDLYIQGPKKYKIS